MILGTKSERQQVGFIPMKMWIWSGIPLIARSFCLLLVTIPVMYLNGISANKSFTLRDAAGRIISQGTLENGIDVSGLQAGVYFVEVEGVVLRVVMG